MIKTALKHWIYEMCIDLIFNTIEKNFVSIPRDLYNAKKGDRFKLITSYNLCMDDGRADGVYNFTNCVVLRRNKYSLDFRGWYVEGDKYCDSVYIKYWAITDYKK